DRGAEIHRAEIAELDSVLALLDGKTSLREVPLSQRAALRSAISQIDCDLEQYHRIDSRAEFASLAGPRRELRRAIEYVPTWVVIGVALCLGVGTTVGYKRVVITIAEKLG